MGFFKKNDKQKIKESILKEQIDFDNVMASAFHAKPLYDELKVIYHPDKFIDGEKNAKATELFQSITENKENYKILLELKERGYKELFNNDYDALQ